MQTWWWLAPTLSVIGLALGFTYFWLGRKPKRIYYEVAADQALMSRGSKQGWADLSVSYAGEIVAEPRIVTIRFRNAGKVELRTDDYEEPLEVVVSRGRVVAAYLVFQADGEPNSERVQPARQDDGQVTAPPMLLNPGDLLECRLLIDGHVVTNVRGRLAGFKLRPQPVPVIYQSALQALAAASIMTLPQTSLTDRVAERLVGAIEGRSGPPDPE